LGSVSERKWIVLADSVSAKEPVAPIGIETVKAWTDRGSHDTDLEDADEDSDTDDNDASIDIDHGQDDLEEIDLLVIFDRDDDE
jgi:hypothetical protein